MNTPAAKPQTAEVTCVTKNDRYNPFERITHIGGRGWKLTQEDAISKIERREWNLLRCAAGDDKDRLGGSWGQSLRE